MQQTALLEPGGEPGAGSDSNTTCGIPPWVFSTSADSSGRANPKTDPRDKPESSSNPG